MSKRKGSVGNPRQHLAREKGHNTRNARPGNKNGTLGPRLGRHNRPALAAPPNPVADPSRAHRRRSKRDKSGGRDFTKGQNSHDGTVFRRGRDQFPRGNGTLMLRCVFHDIAEKIYRSLCKLPDTPRGALAFMQEYIDRTEGRPIKKIENAERRPSVFIFTNKDGVEVPALPAPQKTGGSATAAAIREDLVILGPELGKA